MTDVMLIFEIGKGETLKRVKEIEVSYKDQRFLLEQGYGINRISDVLYNNYARPRIKLKEILVTKYAVKGELGYELRYKFIEKVSEIYAKEVEFFNEHATVTKDVFTDTEGCSYSSVSYDI